MYAIRSYYERKNDIEKPKLDGRLSVSSYSNVSDYGSNHRLRYNFSMNTHRIAGSKFSTETYLMFTHKLNDWSAVKKDINNALKVYNLSVSYDISPTSRISLGRRINLNMANIGAADGLQYEKTKGNFTFGAMAGSRPDYFNYSFNPNLLQAGAFVSHKVTGKNGEMQNSFAIFDQTNHLKTDRQFIYLQHANSLVKLV